ncbi:hypothetical protein GCM10007388_04420 [Pseudoduganella plicata]|uniref:Uncharacterized protein n=1 Tax=Pseudoduganella plicata TaxID=321984 RepID=A0AA87XZJ9_9BURK|nr:hypothetical protein GCM10007388_04420 [Pseudoduganella plicata]
MRAHGLVGANDKVGTQQLVRVPVQAGAQAVDEKARGRERRDGDDKGNEKEAKLAGPPVAGGHAEGLEEHEI